MKVRVDLNADMGEGCGDDAALLDVVTSANIACGVHAGDPATMARTLRSAHQRGVAVGAHPSLWDHTDFGRVEQPIEADAVGDLVRYQLAALAAIARAAAVPLHHVKPHGALYNMAARDRELADAIARAVRGFDATLVLVGLAGSALVAAGATHGLRVAAEVFADRNYEPDGSLTPRSRPGAVLHESAVVVRRAVRMVHDGSIVATDGSVIAVRADTICVHGDTPGAVTLARQIRTALERSGVAVGSYGSA
ncbi:MAG: LamB/YcsF family protein [Burkholderiales bacterium]|nr:LamB/YcsF family protein [Burkholderiales bacterium]